MSTAAQTISSHSSYPPARTSWLYTQNVTSTFGVVLGSIVRPSTVTNETFTKSIPPTRCGHFPLVPAAYCGHHGVLRAILFMRAAGALQQFCIVSLSPSPSLRIDTHPSDTCNTIRSHTVHLSVCCVKSHLVHRVVFSDLVNASTYTSTNPRILRPFLLLRVPIIIMPIVPRQICPNLVIPLRILQNLHIHVHNTHPLGRTPEPGQRSDKRHCDLR